MTPMQREPFDRRAVARAASRRPRLGDRRLPLHVDGPRRGARRVFAVAHSGRALRRSRPRSRAPARSRATDAIRCRASDDLRGACSAAGESATTRPWSRTTRAAARSPRDSGGCCAGSATSEALVLDGGFAAWEAAQLPVESGRAALGRGPLSARARSRPTPSSRRTRSPRSSPRAVCSSTRAAARATAASKSRSIRSPGHVPGAVNRPFSENVTAAGRFKRRSRSFAAELRGAARRPRPRRRRRDVRLGRDGLPLAARDGRRGARRRQALRGLVERVDPGSAPPDPNRTRSPEPTAASQIAARALGLCRGARVKHALVFRPRCPVLRHSHEIETSSQLKNVRYEIRGHAR